MTDEQDTIDAWWAQQESDERWQRHIEKVSELREATKEIRDGISQRHDPVKILT